MLKPKACVKAYWNGQKKALQMRKRGSAVELRQSLLSSPDYNLDLVLLSMEHELVLTMTKFSLNLSNF